MCRVVYYSILASNNKRNQWVKMSKKTQRERQERQFRTKVLIIAAVGVAALALIAGGVFWFLQSKRPSEPEAKTEQPTAVQERVVQAEKDGKLRDNAAAEAEKGDVTKVNQIYAQAIATENDTIRKIQLYVDQSGVLYAAGKYTEAFEAAKQAESLSNDKFLAADWLSRIYEDQKDYVNAAKYYRLAGQWAGGPQNQTGISKAQYDKDAERVTKLASGEAQ